MKHWFILILALASIGPVKGQQTRMLGSRNIADSAYKQPPTRTVKGIEDGYIVTYTFDKATIIDAPLYKGRIMWNVAGFGVEDTPNKPAQPYRVDSFTAPDGYSASVKVVDSLYVDFSYSLSPDRPPLTDSGDGTYIKKNIPGMFAMSISAQTYSLVLSEGKKWKCATVNRFDKTDTTCYYNIYVSGDTIVNNHNCKKIKVQDEKKLHPTQTVVAYEDDGKVYKVENENFYLLFDIGLKKGDIVNVGYVLKEDNILIDGKSCKRIVVDSGIDSCDGDYLYAIIEGIGVTKDEFVGNLHLGNDQEYGCMVSCSENGKVLIDKQNMKSIETGICTPTFFNGIDNTYYDLTGKKAIHPLKGQVYIYNGTKIIY